MPTSPVYPHVAPDAHWTEMHMEQGGMLAVCPALPTSNLPVGQALIIEQEDDNSVVSLDDLLAAWSGLIAGENLFALVHAQDFTALSDRVPRLN